MPNPLNGKETHCTVSTAASARVPRLSKLPIVLMILPTVLLLIALLIRPSKPPPLLWLLLED